VSPVPLERGRLVCCFLQGQSVLMFASCSGRFGAMPSNPSQSLGDAALVQPQAPLLTPSRRPHSQTPRPPAQRSDRVHVERLQSVLHCHSILKAFCETLLKQMFIRSDILANKSFEATCVFQYVTRLEIVQIPDDYIQFNRYLLRRTAAVASGPATDTHDIDQGTATANSEALRG
jgi:hypothetical protein